MNGRLNRKATGREGCWEKEQDEIFACCQGAATDTRPYTTSVNALFAASRHISIYPRQRADEGLVVWGDGEMININSRAD